MSRSPRRRYGHPIWLLVLLPLALPFLAVGCSDTETGTDSAPATRIGRGDLTGIDVKVHQAVG